MTFLTRISLANRLIVGLITLAIIVFGVLATLSLKQELLPSIQAPTAIITARFPGASPQIVADEVATPVGTAVKGISGVTKVQSSSSNGNSIITVEWDYGLDSDKLVADIRSGIDSLAATLPEGVQTDVRVGSTDEIPVLELAVASDASLNASSRLVDKVAVPQLTGIKGVRQVILSGENATRLVVTLRPQDMRKHDLSAQAVTQAIQARAVVVPAGTSYDRDIELAVEVGSSLDSLKQVQALPVTSASGPVALGTVADVRVASVTATSVARSDGRPALALTVLKDSDADAVEISHAVDDMLPGLQEKLGNNTTFSTVFDQAPMIEQSIHDLAVEGGLGLAFAVVIILLFLFSVRSTVITAISIPLSLLIAMIGLQIGSYSLNIFTLAALTVAIGRVVDDSIVVIENIKRRASGHQSLTPGDIVASVRQVAGAVTASTLTTVAVFLPVAVVSGVVGELFRPFAVTIAVALAASLLVSMTIVPVLAYWFLREGGRKEHLPARAAGPYAVRHAGEETHSGEETHAGAGSHAGAETPAGAETHADETRVTRLQRGYLPVLLLALRHPVLTLGLALVVFAGTLASATLLKTDFLGSVTDQSTLQVTQKLPSGTRLSATSAAADQVEKLLADSPEVSGYLTTIGGGGIQTGPNLPSTNSNEATFTVTLPDGVEASTEIPRLQGELDQVRAAGEITVSSANTQTTNNNLSVVVTGDNSDDLRTGAQRVEQLLGSVGGLTDIRSDLAEQRKVLKVQVDLKKAAAQGFTQSEVGQAVAGSLTGSKAGTVTLQGETRDILVKVQRTDATPADIAALELPVSQLQQQKAQDKASDHLTAEQKATTKKAQKEADQAAADQSKALRKQRNKAQDGLRDARKSLTDAKKQLDTLQASPPPPPNPQVPGVPVTTDTLSQQQYAQQVQQSTAQVSQLEASVEQTQKSIDQLNDQLDSADEQAGRTVTQRKESNDLQDEQAALADVRAKPIRVRDVAAVREVLAPTTVTQIDGTPSVTITATPPEGGDLGALTKTIQQKLDTSGELPAGVTATLGGASQDQQDAFRQLGLAMLVAILLVFIIMVATFGSVLQPLILLISIPFAATGAIAGLLVTDTPLGVPSMIGLLMLIGIVVTNAIVLIDLINQYRASGQDLQSAVVDGARLRFRPIIMTACATVCALIPMGLGLTGGGAFISRPLAIVVIGGLVSSTILTLLLVPVLYSLVERRSERRQRAGQYADASRPGTGSAHRSGSTIEA